MAFITLALPRTDQPRRARVWRLRAALLATLLLGAGQGTALAQGFTVQSAETKLEDKVFVLSARIEYQFSEDTLEALENGVPLFIGVDIEVLRERRWWWDDSIAKLGQRYLLLYHALSEKYVVHNLNSGAQSNYSYLSAALDALGKIDNLPLIDESFLGSKGKFIGRIRAYLDIESLPAPVRPLAYLSPNWRLESDWFKWSLKP